AASSGRATRIRSISPSMREIVAAVIRNIKFSAQSSDVADPAIAMHGLVAMMAKRMFRTAVEHKPMKISQRTETGAMWLAMGLVAVMSVYFSIRSEGFLEADACTHYLFARHALDHPQYLVDVWGRPWCTGL